MAPKAAPDTRQVVEDPPAVVEDPVDEHTPPPSKQPQQDQIEISIKSQTDVDEMHFKVKPTTKVSKVIKAYCAKHAVDAEMMRFLFDGQRIGVDDGRTCGELELEDGDVIEVLVEQIGGV